MVENVANEFRVVWGVYWYILFENYKELKGDLCRTQSGWPLAFQYSVSVLGYVLNIKFLNKWLCLYLCRGHSCPTCMPFSHTFNWSQCEFCMHKGCIEDAGSLMLYCCILFFICLTIFSGTLLKWKHFIAKINLCCYFLSALAVEK